MSQALLLGTLFAAAAVALATAAGWLGAALVSVIADRLGAWPPAFRARILAQARLLPLALTMVLVPAQIAAFVRFEAGGDEAPGPLLVLLAVAGVTLLAASCRAGIRSARDTRAVEQLWRRSAESIALPGWPFRAWRISRRDPVVAILGILRPGLFVARPVSEVCTHDELAAIVAHERAHVRAGDNLLRWLFAITPGAVLAAPIARRLERAWQTAAEHAADAAAGRDVSRLDLASALTKVARLAAALPPPTALSSAFIGGSDLSTRVARLLDPPPRDRVSGLGWLPALVVAAVALLLLSTPAAVALHETFEWLVRKGS
jgi:beta-lactamase regulating signal transducer with metallopeptidase domain